jgi:ABC-2 type transport system permease protein
MIAAILRAQLRSMRFGGRGSVFSVVTALIWYGLWFFGACVAGYVAAHASSGALDEYLPLGLLAVCLYWQLVPVVSATMGSALDMRKLLAYPIPHGKLFQVELLLRAIAGLEMILPLAGVGLGLIANPAGGASAALRVMAAFLLFMLFNVLLASGMRSVLERLLTRRKVRELLAIVMACLWLLPRLLMESGVRLKSLGPVAPYARAFGLPWTAAAHAALASSAWLSLPALLLWTALAAWFGRRQFERNLRYDPLAAQATVLGDRPPRSQAVTEPFFRLPSLLWRDPLAGLVEKELRSLSRTPRFRMIFVMGFTFGLMMWLPMVIGRHASDHSTMSRYFLTIVCGYSLTLLGQVTYWNCFGFDRSAALLYFAVPQPITTVLVGKNIASLVFIYLELLVLSAITAAFGMLGGWGHWLETVATIGVCSVYLLAMGNVSSVNYPRALHPERVSQGGSGGRFQGLLFLLYPLALLPVFLAFVARYAFDSQWAFWLVLALAAVIGGIVYWIALESAVNTARTRREAILQELSKSDGPVAQ